MFPTSTNDYAQCSDYRAIIDSASNKITDAIYNAPTYFNIEHSNCAVSYDTALEYLLNDLVFLESKKEGSKIIDESYRSQIQYNKFNFTASEITSNHFNWYEASINAAYAMPNRPFIYVNIIPRNFDLFISTFLEKFEENKKELDKTLRIEEPPKQVALLEKAYALSAYHKVKIYKSGDTYRIFTNQINHTFNYKIFGTIPAIFQNWNFSQDFINVCVAIGTQNLEALDKALNTYLNNIDLKRLSIQQALTTCSFGVSTKLIESYKQKINNTRNLIRSCEERIETYFANIRAFTDKIFVLENTNIAPQKKALINFLRKCPYIKAIRAVDSSKINLIIEAPLSNWDTRAAEKIIETSCKDYPDFTKWFLRQILIEEKVTLYYTNRILIDFSNYTAYAQNSDTHKSKKLPNPHLEYFNCWGQNKTMTCQYLSEYRFEEAITQIIATVGMMNFYDATVVNYFKNDIVTLTTSGNVTFKNTLLTNTETGEVLTMEDLYQMYNNEIMEEYTNG